MSEVLKIRKKPSELTAMQFTGGEANGNEIMKWMLKHGGRSTWMGESKIHKDTGGTGGWPEKMYIQMTENPSGTAQVPVGNWIILDVDGQFRNESPESFYVKYDRVDPDEISFDEAFKKALNMPKAVDGVLPC